MTRRVTRRDIYTIALAMVVFIAGFAALLWMMRNAIGGPS